jgi:hypothetical protein
LFALTTFLSAALLFLLEPMFAKMALPLLGGSPAVWNTCLVFFQVALLAGYAYAHAGPAWLGVRPHAFFHLAFLLTPLLVLPIAISQNWSPPGNAFPVVWLLGLLGAVVGLPFFAVATNGTLLQKWFASTRHAGAGDPYFLYTFSNLGSMLALLSYPFFIEPSFPLAEQGRRWTWAYEALLVLMFGCALAVWLRPKIDAGTRRHGDTGTGGSSVPASPCPRVSVSVSRWRWLALAFVPSSLMVSVTTYLTTDIASLPLLWIIPLAIYLLSFILTFARRPWLPHYWMARSQPLLVIALALVMLSEATELAKMPVFALLGLHVLVLFNIAMVCHAELAIGRPPARRLTEFYLWLAAGGALGGLFASLAAPLLFPTVAEYPLVLVLACLLRPRFDAEKDDDPKAGRRDVTFPLALGLVTVALVLGAQALDIEPGQASVALVFAVPLVVCYTFLQRPVRFGLGLGAVLLAGGLYHGVHGQVIYRERSFFGVHRVTRDPTGRFHELVHGSTVHGRQSLHPSWRREPLTYYHPTGPIGEVFRTFSGKLAKPYVGIVGLGAGSLAAYGEPGQHFTYYEIDPVVARIAGDRRFFTFLADSRAKVDIVLGDARLTLAQAPDGRYGLLVIDAFSSDAIPLHLLTREAMRRYKSKLADDGLLAFNISNRYFDLRPVIARLAQAEGLVCWSRDDLELDPVEKEGGKSPSQWLVLARQKDHLGPLTRDGRWGEIRPAAGQPVWTDDFSNLFSVFKWKDEG